MLGIQWIKFICDDRIPNQSFEVVVANIIAPILIDLAPQITQACKTTIILSGLLIDQEQRVLKAYRGWVVDKRITEGEWVGLILKDEGHN